MATLDHIGLNRYIYMSASIDDMTLGSFDMTEISNVHSQSILGTDLDDSRLILGINLYNNGPYGYSSWQQLRMSENPLSRHLRKNNQFPIIGNSRERVYYKGRKRHVVPDKYGTQFVLDEPAVISNYKPIILVGSVDEYNKKGLFFPRRFRKKISMNNDVAYFTNDKINKIAGIVEQNDQVYDTLKGYYLEDALNSSDSPLSSFEKLIFSQTVYPPQKYTYKSYTRERTTFTFNWNSNASARSKKNLHNNFAKTVRSASIWPLDVDPNWVNFATDDYVNNFGITNTSGSDSYVRFPGPVTEFYQTRNTTSSSFGVLWNHYSQFSEGLENIGEPYYNINLVPSNRDWNVNDFLHPAPLYSRRHTLLPSESCIAPTGKTSLISSNDITRQTRFGGEAAWDVPRQSGKYPFYDKYSDYSENIRLKGKDYTIIPEFRMSEHVPRFLSSSIFNTPNSLLELTGGKINCSNSSENNFYEIYSNSDFMKNFDIILEDHKDFTDPSKITLKCKAMKKLIPYDGFYPVQRTVKMAEQFYSSYSDYVRFSTASVTNPYGWSEIEIKVNHSFQNIMAPLFAPGVLYNTIKSGVAVDYPIITSSLETSRVSTDASSPDYYISNGNFDKRIPFEALIEPEKHLSDYNLICNEPHPSGNLSSSAFWDGQGDRLYTRMANNFLAEVPNFFLKDESFTTLASSPQNDPNFGQVKLLGINTPLVYSMRVKMYRSMDSANFSVTSSNNATGIQYIPPQDIVRSGRKETMTMYSRPSAFGPPTQGVQEGTDDDNSTNAQDPYLADENNANLIKTDSSKGFNYPFTPPYYHGQAWADITFRPAESKKYSVSEIMASCSVEYYRFDPDFIVRNINNNFTTGAAAPSKLRETAMSLDASVNLFSKGTLGEIPDNLQNALSGLNIQVDDQSRSRWIIQPKFETPILNFNHHTIGEDGTVTMPSTVQRRNQTPIGMWHQYGKIPSQEEGIFLQVTEIPKNWVLGRLTHSNYAKTGSLADLCGFSQEPIKLGQINQKKKISECVVAIPFVENRGVKEFFKLNKKFVDEAINGESTAEETIVDLVDKMNRFIFPPTFDFVNFPKNVDPIAMYVFEFSSYLSQQDLADIWQNVLPNIGRDHEYSESSISHSLIGKKKLINRKKLREDLRWMVFKVKQRASSRYYDEVYKKKGNKLTDIISEVSTDSVGPRSKIQYNWPYDFFSLVELVKIDTSIEFSDVETDDQGTEQPRPKVAKEENRRVQLNTLFPKGKK